MSSDCKKDTTIYFRKIKKNDNCIITVNAVYIVFYIYVYNFGKVWGFRFLKSSVLAVKSQGH